MWRIGLDPLEQTIHHAKVVVVVGIERRAETMQEAGGRKRCGRWGSGARPLKTAWRARCRMCSTGIPVLGLCWR
jgi:hypothetical protein